MPAESAQGGVRPPVKLKAKVPVAKPADPGLEVAEVVEDEDFEEPFFSAESLKGFLTSFALHGVLLLVLAFWYFAPPYHPPRTIDTRMAGCRHGRARGPDEHGRLEFRAGDAQGPHECRRALHDHLGAAATRDQADGVVDQDPRPGPTGPPWGAG